MLVSLPCHSLTPKVQHLLPCFPRTLSSLSALISVHCASCWCRLHVVASRRALLMNGATRVGRVRMCCMREDVTLL